MNGLFTVRTSDVAVAALAHVLPRGVPAPSALAADTRLLRALVYVCGRKDEIERMTTVIPHN